MRKSREITLGNERIGGKNPPLFQTMITTPLENKQGAAQEIEDIFSLGCRVIRTSVRSPQEVEHLADIVAGTQAEIIADIHFDYTLALKSIDAGVSGVRFNPGNVGGKDRVCEIVEKAQNRENLALRIGVNSGSLEKDLLKKHGGVSEKALVESTLRWVSFLEDELNFHNFKISAKSSSVNYTVSACREIATHTDAPFHVGITEAGGGRQGLVKSAIGIGILINEGLADTFRVSLTEEPIQEIIAGMHILKTTGYLKGGGEIISCPTCGRTHGKLMQYYRRLEHYFEEKRWWLQPALSVALMGCEVNGPGEAREADMGIALGRNGTLLFSHGNIVHKYTTTQEAYNALIDSIEKKWHN